ncbi:MAG: cupin domain-containing protein [candidate division NC10 bacterium]|nr:cupin domain-containing protein [candidate division NC10 bacterium]
MRTFRPFYVGIFLLVLIFGSIGSIAKAVEHPEGQVVEQPVFEDPGILVVDLFFSPGSSLGRHTHFDPAVVHVLSGSLTVVIADGDRRTLTSGDALIIPARRVHTSSNDGVMPSKVRLIILKTPLMGQPRGI